jgi:hypothetical protein
MKGIAAIAIAIVATSFVAGSAAVFVPRAGVHEAAASQQRAALQQGAVHEGLLHQGTIQPVWAEEKWPFLLDQWGIGKAFVCMPADCGVKIDVYIRPKIGFCNCSNGVYDDAELERVSDNELLSQDFKPIGPSRHVKVGWMYGLSRPYLIIDDNATSKVNAGTRALSIAFNDECDVVVALATLGDGDPATLEPAVVAFLNTRPVVLWAKKELGLEFARRDW